MEGEEGADLEANYNLCLVLKTMLQKSCHENHSNMTLFAAISYTHTNVTACCMTQLVLNFYFL